MEWDWEEQDPPAFTPVTSLVIMKSGMLLASLSPTAECMISSCMSAKEIASEIVPATVKIDREEVFSNQTSDTTTVIQ